MHVSLLNVQRRDFMPVICFLRLIVIVMEKVCERALDAHANDGGRILLLRTGMADGESIIEGLHLTSWCLGDEKKVTKEGERES